MEVEKGDGGRECKEASPKLALNDGRRQRGRGVVKRGEKGGKAGGG